MIIYTTENIKKLNPKKVSTIVDYAGGKYCLAEVDDSFDLSQDEVDKNDLQFWWAVSGGTYIDIEQWDYEEKYNGGLVEGIEFVYSLSKENNIAMTINTIAHNAGLSPFELWESALIPPSH